MHMPSSIIVTTGCSAMTVVNGESYVMMHWAQLRMQTGLAANSGTVMLGRSIQQCTHKCTLPMHPITVAA